MPKLRNHIACLTFYLLSVLGLVLGPLGHGWGFVDLAIYRDGGQGVLDGASLYHLRFPGALAFTYPPISALSFTILAVIRMAVLAPLVTVSNMVLTPVMLFFALRVRPMHSLIERDASLSIALILSAFAIWLEPLWTTLRYGQINILIAVLILVDISRPDRSRWKGVGIGLAAGLKLTPGLFGLYMLFTRRYRAAAMSLAVFIGTVAAGFVGAPADSREYWSGAFMDPRRVGRIENTANQSLRGAISRAFHSLDVQSIWLPTAVIVAVLGLSLAVRAGRRRDDAIGFSLCAITGLLISPISWSHHWVLAIPALAILVVRSWQTGSRSGLALSVFMAVIAYSHVIWWVPVNKPRHSELHLNPLQLAYSNAYVLVGVACLIYFGQLTLRLRQTVIGPPRLFRPAAPTQPAVADITSP